MIKIGCVQGYKGDITEGYDTIFALPEFYILAIRYMVKNNHMCIF